MEVIDVKGYRWPASDRHCRAVVFNTTPDMDIALSHVKHFDVALQAGGNMGVWANHLSRKFKRVVTAEPDPLNFRCLIENVSDNVECIRAAFGQEVGTTGMKTFGDNVGAHYLEGDGDIGIITIDSLDLPALDYLCLDLEGYEMPAIRGAAETIGKWRPVIQIEDKGLSEKYGYKKGDAERYLFRNFGYRVVARVHRDVILVA